MLLRGVIIFTQVTLFPRVTLFLQFTLFPRVILFPPTVILVQYILRKKMNPVFRSRDSHFPLFTKLIILARLTMIFSREKKKTILVNHTILAKKLWNETHCQSYLSPSTSNAKRKKRKPQNFVCWLETENENGTRELTENGKGNFLPPIDKCKR